MVLSVSFFCILQESMAPYLSLPTVLDGLFNLTKTLFGINIEQVDHLASVFYITYFIL